VFEDLRDAAVLLFSRNWPIAEGSITRVYVDPYERGFYLRVAYEFSIGTDGPYTGESSCPTWFGGTDVMDINESFKIGSVVPIRYKATNPSVNKIDPSFWSDLENAL
jgi:hypothetical protein